MYTNISEVPENLRNINIANLSEIKLPELAEQISGGVYDTMNKIEEALRVKFLAGKKNASLYLQDVKGKSAIYRISDYSEAQYKQATYSVEFSYIDKQFTFGEPKEVEIKEVVITKEETPQLPNPENFLMEETVNSAESGEISLSGKILLEESKESKGTIKARVPMIKIGQYTDNGNRYFEECWTWLMQDISRLSESTKSRKVLDMYPTHKPALDPKDPSYFMLRAAIITEASRIDDIGYIHFETLKEAAGPTIAEQIGLGMIGGVSLRAFPKEGYFETNNKGGHDVKRLTLLGCDFTDVGAMPFEANEKGFKLEEENTMNPEEIKALQDKAAADEAEKKRLVEENKALKESEKKAAVERRRNMLIEHVTAKVAGIKDFGDITKAGILEDAKNAVVVVMAEQDNDEVAKLKLEEFITKSVERRKKEIIEAQKQIMEQQKSGINNPAMLNLLSEQGRQVGFTKEITGGSVRLRDLILSKIYNRPMYQDGKFLLEQWDDKLQPLIDQQIYYMEHVGRSQNDLFAVGGMLHNLMLTEEMKKAVAPLLMEANEASTSGVIGSNLPHEVAAALIYAAYPETVAMQIAKTGDMKSSTKDIFEIGYPTNDDQVFKRGKHMFGFIEHGGLSTLVTNGSGLDATTYGDGVDDGALSAASNQYGDHLFVVVVEAVNATTAITWTGLDENGDSATWTVSLATTDAAGTIKRCTPTNVGQKCTDISAVLATGMSTAGQIIAFVEKPITSATVGSAEDLAYLGISKQTATEDEYDLGARIDISLVEDMQMAMRDGSGGLDYLALLVQALQQGVVNQIDRKMLYEICDDSTGGSQTFAQATVPEGSTQTEWNKKFLYYNDLTVDEVAYSGNFEPNWAVWSRADRSRFMEWLGDGWTKYNVQRNELHLQSRSIGNIAGCEVMTSKNARRNRIVYGTRGVGVHYYIYVPFVIFQADWVPSLKAKAIMVHHRAAVKITQPKTLGKLVIS